MRLRVVLDVNVLASAAVSSQGAVWTVVQMALRREFEFMISDHILDTLGVVLTRPYFLARVPAPVRESLLASLADVTTSVEPDERVRGVTDDAEDDLVLGTAVAAEADYLVTGDHGLLALGAYGGVRIVTAYDLLALLDEAP